MQSAITSSIQDADVDDAIKGTTLNATQANLSGKSFNVTADGVTKNIAFTDADFANGDDISTILNNKFAAAFGTDDKGFSKISASEDNGVLTIDSNTSQGYETAISVTSGTTGSDALSSLGLTSGSSNRLNTSSTLFNSTLTASDLTNLVGADSDGNYSIYINNDEVKLNTSDSISTIFRKINSSSAGVTANYNSTLDSISMTANSSGAQGNISLGTDTSSQNFFTNLLGSSPTTVNGRDAVFTIDGAKMTRPSNSFTIDGATYTINSPVQSTSPQASTVNFTADTSTAEQKITNFINAYNTLLGSIYTQVNTKPDPSYQPLTDTQRASLSDSQVTTWETNAKAGILYNDPTLNSIADQLRQLVMSPVTTSDGTQMSLYSIGISTSDDYTQGGKLSITNETALQNALQQTPDLVSQLFTKSSSTMFDINGADQAQRRTDEGLGYRIKDILDSAVTSYGGVQGSIVSVIGDQNNTTTYGNSIFDQLAKVNSDIDDYTTQLTDATNRYYTQFSQLESSMEEMNTQSSWISSELGS
jgi:flagellar hook-associated protein 2